MFTTHAILKDLGTVDSAGRAEYELTQPLVFDQRVNGGGLKFTVPRGFVTNMASTPRLLWSIFPPAGKWNRAAILHDYLYSPNACCSRFLADCLFREAMATLNVPWWRRVLMYYAVRLFGAGSYTPHKGDSCDEANDF